MNSDLLDLLIRVQHELDEHDCEYHHHTDQRVLLDLQRAIKDLEEREQNPELSPVETLSGLALR